MQKNINYLNANPLENLKVLAMGEAINSQQGFVEAIKNPAKLVEVLPEKSSNTLESDIK